MKKIFTIYVLLSISFFLAGCGGSKKETVNDSDAVPDDDIATADSENDLTEDYDVVPDEEDEKSDEDSGEEADDEDETDDFSLIQECFGKKVLTKETVEVDCSPYNNYFYQIDRYYDKNCRVKFESKYRIVPDAIISTYNNKSYEYDEKGNVKQICKRNRNGKIIDKCQQFSYEFNDDGTIKKMCIGKQAEGKETGCVHYFYDKNGRIKQRIRRSAVKEILPFFRDFSDEKAEYSSDIYAVSESVNANGNTLSEELDMQERVDYIYNEKGNVTEKKRYFIHNELDENGNDAAVYYYGYVPDYIASIDMTAKKRITYDYSDGLPVKSRHNVYAYYMTCSGAAWSWHKRKYEKEYFYDEEMRPVRITTRPDERNLVSIDEETEYYPEGSLKRKVTTFDDDGITNGCSYYNPKAEERIYDEKGRETGYNKIGYSGEVYERTTRTFYDNSSEVKHETVCDEEEKCKSYSYTYKHDDLGRITEKRKEYDDPVYERDSETWELIPLKQVDVTYYKYTATGKLKETRTYMIRRDYYDENTQESVSKQRIEIYIYDEKDRLVEVRSNHNWYEEDPENPNIGSWSAQYTEYDSLDRVIGDNSHIYEYRGDTDMKYKTWLRWGTTVLKYDEKGNLVSEKYDKGAQRYDMETEYDEEGYPVSAVKKYPDDSDINKETRTYFYETFQLP